MEIQRGAMVYQPKLVMPGKHIGIAGRAVYIHQQAIQPDYFRGQQRINLCNYRIESYSARQVMQRQVKSGAGFQQILYFFVGLCAAEGFIQVGEYDLGYFKTDSTGNFTTDQLGDQRLWPLPCPSKFEHIQKAVV